MTTASDRQLLLQIARDAIWAHVIGAPAPPVVVEGAAARAGGVFVTVHHRGELRGCIGHVEADEQLGASLARCAVAACSADPRFQPVEASELPDIDIEISLIGPLEPVDALQTIEVGRHGLVVEDRWHRGLLLPQVATEWGWDREMFLAQACRKAGLAHDAWRHGATIWRFEAEVFGEGQEGSGGPGRSGESRD